MASLEKLKEQRSYCSSPAPDRTHDHQEKGETGIGAPKKPFLIHYVQFFLQALRQCPKLFPFTQNALMSNSGLHPVPSTLSSVCFVFFPQNKSQGASYKVDVTSYLKHNPILPLLLIIWEMLDIFLGTLSSYHNSICGIVVTEPKGL